jgi:hypothetical protein
VKEGEVGIQGELQAERSESLWIFWQAPKEIKGLVLVMPFQSQEVAEMDEGERKDSEFRYLPESWDTQRQSAPVRSFQPSFAIRDKFTSFILLKPKPPEALGIQREFHDFKDRFLVFELGKPHQKFLKDLSSWLQMLLGSKKVLIA